ncbi:MAG: phosphatidylglycerol lysyltransferase domain-containing protein [Gaiellaceae bacterium]
MKLETQSGPDRALASEAKLDGAGHVLQVALDRHGRSPLSFLLRYEAPWRTFALGCGVVGYLEARRAAVGWTDPLVEDEALPELLDGFVRAMRAQRRGVCLLAVSEQTARVALEQGFSALKVGEEPWFDLASWRQPRGNRGKKLRWAANHAHRAGLLVEEYRPAEGRNARVEAQIATVLERWRASLRRSEPKSFMRAAPLAAPRLKRIFLALRDGEAQAALSCARLPAVDGWYLEDIVRVPEAVNGATELLVLEALVRLGTAGSRGAGFALAPMRGVSDQFDPRARWLGRLLSLAIRGFDHRYGFHGMARYEARFQPSLWKPSYVVFLPALPRPAVIRAAVRCLSA